MYLIHVVFRFNPRSRCNSSRCCYLGRSWAKIGQRKSQPNVRSGEIPSSRQTSIDKTNDCAMKSERGALVRGSDPPSGHSVHKTTGNTWPAPARRLIQTYFGRCCVPVENRRQKISIPLRWQKIGLFSGLGEARSVGRTHSIVRLQT